MKVLHSKGNESTIIVSSIPVYKNTEGFRTSNSIDKHSLSLLCHNLVEIVVKLVLPTRLGACKRKSFIKWWLAVLCQYYRWSRLMFLMFLNLASSKVAVPGNGWWELSWSAPSALPFLFLFSMSLSWLVLLFDFVVKKVTMNFVNGSRGTNTIQIWYMYSPSNWQNPRKIVLGTNERSSFEIVFSVLLI